MIIELLSTLDIETRSLLSIHQQLKKENKSTPVRLRDKPTINDFALHSAICVQAIGTMYTNCLGNSNGLYGDIIILKIASYVINSMSSAMILRKKELVNAEKAV
ncbi:hypothetical protein F9C07_8021 [Aspergillus flavus]|uniref:Uncharacterized protein n=1 Tax=Aspergillus flavus (strain ATCC 200026 / FGSC A1120 / IAM 13836 / NRRL 3357 / JCM 12722 / SRRC 167) TaxID=332952 RepID=A0A7U2R310_ASPFN|nr:hypothetical protein F9C07_8021 [Aspergillus flavus]